MNKLLKTIGLIGLLGIAVKTADAVEKKNYDVNKSTSIYSVQKSTETKPISQKKSGKLEFELGAGIQSNAKNPAQEYIDGVNQDFRDGKYTFTTPIPQWRDISISSPVEMPLEISVLYKLSEKTAVGLTGKISGASMESRYNETYDIWDPTYMGGTYIPTNFDRKENIKTNSSSFGVKVKAKLAKWLSGFFSAKQDNYNVSGKVDYALHRPDTNYTQWRKANYSGNNSGTSLEAGLDWNITDNIAVGVSAGQRSGKMQTEGTEVKTASSNPGMSWTKSYDPEFNYNSTFAGINLVIKF